MRDVALWNLIALCAGVMAFSPSCSSIRRETSPTEQEQKLPDNAAMQTQAYTEEEHESPDDAAKQAQAYLAGGEYRKALERYAAAYEKHRNPKMRASYARAGEQIMMIADAAYRKQDFAQAGAVYNVLLASGITVRDFSSTLSFDDFQLNSQLQVCSKVILEAGLRAYRDGKLEDAVAIWNKALIFDRANKDIRSAIETATVQLQNLKKLK